MQMIKITEFSTNLIEALKGNWTYVGSASSYYIVVKGVGLWATNGIMDKAVSIEETLPECHSFYLTIQNANGFVRNVRVDGGQLNLTLNVGESASGVFKLKN